MLVRVLRNADELLIVGSAQGIAIGRWLADRAPTHRPTQVHVVEDDLDALSTLRNASCATATTAVLAMGDGSACRTEKAPGYLDYRAFPFDDRIAAALSDANAAALMHFDQQEAQELLVAGRLVWPAVAQVVAEDGRPWTGDLMHRADPYGVSYFVALWEPVS